MKKPYLSVIIPCYNEAANLKRGVLKQINQYLKSTDLAWEVIISDDGSTDESLELIGSQISKWNNFRLLKNPHGGKPAALFFGIKAARGKYVLLTDMDQSTPIDQLDKLLPGIDKGFNVVIGSRGLQREDFPFYRRLGAIVFSSFRRLFLLSEINDTQCGFKLFKKDLVKKAFSDLQFFKQKQRIKGWKVTSYDVELLHIIKKMGENIREIEVKWREMDISTSKGGGLFRYFRESKEMLTQIARVKLNDLKGKYDQ